MVVLCDGNTDKNSPSQPHTSYKISRVNQEVITLTDSTGRVLDKVALPEMKTDVSYGRTLGLAGLFYYDTPTPFQLNGTGFGGYTEMPSFTVEPGLYIADWGGIRLENMVIVTEDGCELLNADTTFLDI